MDTDKKLKFYEAIELGSTLIGEHHGFYYHGAINCGCAIGAGLAAVGRTDGIVDLCEDDAFDSVTAEWPWLATRAKKIPGLIEALGQFPCSTEQNTVAELVSATHAMGMERLKIARILKPFEDALPHNAPAPAFSPAPSVSIVSA